MSSHIDLLIMVNTRYDEEHSGTSCSAFEKSTETEDDSSLVFLEVFLVVSFQIEFTIPDLLRHSLFNIPIKFQIGLFLSSNLATALVKGRKIMIGWNY